jgi:hypothetical protein
VDIRCIANEQLFEQFDCVGPLFAGGLDQAGEDRDILVKGVRSTKRSSREKVKKDFRHAGGAPLQAGYKFEV